LNGGNWRIVAEFTEVESGKRSDRPELDKALAAARVRQVPVVVVQADRLTRSVAFLSRLLEAGVDVRFADLPLIEGATGKFNAHALGTALSTGPLFQTENARQSGGVTHGPPIYQRSAALV
jgi:DNA invertase Pin-like site-specific DNA recombinase